MMSRIRDIEFNWLPYYQPMICYKNYFNFIFVILCLCLCLSNKKKILSLIFYLKQQQKSTF